MWFFSFCYLTIELLLLELLLTFYKIWKMIGGEVDGDFVEYRHFLKIELIKSTKKTDLVGLVTSWGSSKNHSSFSPICSPCWGL